MSDVFRILTPVSYWLLIAMWALILVLVVRRLRSPHGRDRLVGVVLLILSIDAFRVLFESTYFGVWYTARAGWLPQSVHSFLGKAGALFMPEALNVVAAALMIGILLTRWSPAGQDERRGENHLVDELGSHIGEGSRPLREREALIQELEQLTLMDALTGVYNRRGFWILAGRHAQLCRRRCEPFCLVYGDLDRLKWVNDTYGHSAGDELLKAMARVLRESFRESDIVARMGGDEFIVLLAGTPEGEVAAGVRRLETNLEHSPELAALPFQPSISVGVACYDGLVEPDVEGLVREADHRMYAQKRLRWGPVNGQANGAEYGLPLRT